MMKRLLFVFVLSGLLISCQENSNSSNTNDAVEVQSASMISSSNKNETTAAQDEVWLESLITETPQEGRELAIKMARKTIGAIQKDPEVKKRLRKDYAEDPQQLILSAQVVATEFQTVAEANNYWRK